MQCSVIEYQDTIGRKTRYGKKPGPTPWHYTRQLVSTYTDPPDVEEVLRQFESAGCKDEIAAAKWIVVNDEWVLQQLASKPATTLPGKQKGLLISGEDLLQWTRS